MTANSTIRRLLLAIPAALAIGGIVSGCGAQTGTTAPSAEVGAAETPAAASAPDSLSAEQVATAVASQMDSAGSSSGLGDSSAGKRNVTCDGPLTLTSGESTHCTVAMDMSADSGLPPDAGQFGMKISYVSGESADNLKASMLPDGAPSSTLGQ